MRLRVTMPDLRRLLISQASLGNIFAGDLCDDSGRAFGERDGRSYRAHLRSGFRAGGRGTAHSDPVRAATLDPLIGFGRVALDCDSDNYLHGSQRRCRILLQLPDGEVGQASVCICGRSLHHVLSQAASFSSGIAKLSGFAPRLKRAAMKWRSQQLTRHAARELYADRFLSAIGLLQLATSRSAQLLIAPVHRVPDGAALVVPCATLRENHLKATSN